MKKETIILKKDGTAIFEGKICPFRTPLVLPSATIAGQLTIENLPCTSACPLHIFSRWGGDSVQLRCGGGTGVRYEVNVIEEEETIKSNLLM